MKIGAAKSLPTGWVAAIRGVGIPSIGDSTTPKRARAQPPQKILRTHIDGRKVSFDAYALPMLIKGSYTPTTESSVTIKGYRVISFRTSSCNSLQLEGNLRWVWPALNARDFEGDQSGNKSGKDDIVVGQFSKYGGIDKPTIRNANVA
ncbi:hypothetical protein [Pseudomonas fluorescens]|uniref:hypothetical protein n=1 Tax=Pseudomonas fluorescens TaxID=294 RepID=UPI001242756D|nr:hypothetical protein [Pseudomonas fluorescens]